MNTERKEERIMKERPEMCAEPREEKGCGTAEAREKQGRGGRGKRKRTAVEDAKRRLAKENEEGTFSGGPR